MGLTGTKLSCDEGGCGACTVILSVRTPGNKLMCTNSLAWRYMRARTHPLTPTLTHIPDNGTLHLPVNACLRPVASLHGCGVTTIEALAKDGKPHPIQEAVRDVTDCSHMNVHSGTFRAHFVSYRS